MGGELGFAFATRRVAGRSLPPRRPATDVALGPAGFDPRELDRKRRCSCGSQSRAVRRHSERRTATRRSSLLLSAGGELLKSRANSAIPKGIAVLGEGDALAVRGGRAKDECRRMGGGEWGVAVATRRVARFAATPRGVLQLVGARCIHRWRRTYCRLNRLLQLRLAESRGPDASLGRDAQRLLLAALPGCPTRQRQTKVG